MSRLCLPIVVIITVGLAALDNAAGQTAQPAKPRVDQFGDALPDGATARIGTTRYRHGGADLLSYTPDGKSLIFYGSGAVRLMDVASGTQGKAVTLSDSEPRGFRRFDGESASVALSDDTKVLAFLTMSGNTSVTVAETATGKERKTFRGNDLFKNNPGFFQAGLALSPDGKYLLVFPGRNGDRTPLAWVDTTNGQRVHEIAGDKNTRIGHAQFSRDGKQVVALENSDGKGNTTLRIFDAALGAELRTVQVPGNSNFSFELRPDGKTLIASSQQGGPVKLYDYSDKELKELKTFSDQSQFGSHLITRDGRHLYIASRGKIVHWEIASGKEIQKFDAPGMANEDNPFGFIGRMRTHVLAVSPDGKQLAYAGPHAAMVYDTITGKCLAGGGAGAGIGVLKFTPDDKGLIVSDMDRGVQQWEVATVKKGMTFGRFEKEGPRRPRGVDILFTFSGTAGYSEDGKLLAVSMGESGVGVWDVTTGKTKKLYGPEAADKEKEGAFGGLEQMPYAFAFAPRGNLLAVSTSGGAIKLWDAGTGKPLRSWVWHQMAAKPQSPEQLPNQVGMMSLAFSPDGKTLAGGGVYNMYDGLPQSTIILWEAATGKERLRLRTAFKPSGNDEFGMELELLFSVFDNMPMALTFSPDGKHLLVGTFTGLHVIDALTGKDEISFSGRQMVGRTATFSKDGKRLFIGRTDGTIRIIDTAKGRMVRDLPGHADSVLTLALSADGKTLASGSNDSTVLLWDVAEITKPVAQDKVALTGKEMDQLWTDLASPDAAKAFQAINAMASAPAVSVPFLKGKLKPIAPADAKVLQQLLEDLNSEKYPVREKATVELEKLGDLARLALEERLKANPPLEMKQRMEKLVAKLDGPVESAQTLQSMRALETLERVGTPEALAVLTAIAKGAPGHRITEDARESVGRLEKQMKKK